MDNQSDYKIHFNYIETNPLISYTSETTGNYDIPIEFTSKRIISSIQCLYHETQVKEYQINYFERGPGTNPSNKVKCIKSIQEIAYNEIQESQKYNKILFT